MDLWDANVGVDAPVLFSRRMYPMTRRTRSAGLLTLLASVSTALVVTVTAPPSGAATAGPATARRLVHEPDLVTQRAGAGRSFTLAVVPDTQGEVFGSDPRLPNRTNWLVRRAGSLDLRFVVQVGDLTNWGWVDPPQLDKASAGFKILEDAHIPYTVAVGNHDTRAVGWDGHGGYGGSAYIDNPECLRRFTSSECRTQVLVRRTQEINARFPASRFGDVRDEWESGKIDNKYSTFEAGGLDWLVLDLELWPRPEAVAWASQVVRNHPGYNVIVNTHSYLRGDGAIYGGVDYGSTSPKYVWNNLVRKYRNIVMVTCGHVGNARTRVDRGDRGNKIVTMLQNFSRTRTNPVRLVTVDPAAGTLKTRIYAPYTDQRFPKYSTTIKGMKFVSP
jgi:hypothetical protein